MHRLQEKGQKTGHKGMVINTDFLAILSGVFNGPPTYSEEGFNGKFWGKDE